MLLGQMPGDTRTGSSTLFAALPSYATIVGRYLDRFGPYRLQPYAMPAISAPASAPVPSVTLPSAVAPTTTAAGEREPRGRDVHTVGKPFDPVGAGPGVLTGYDQAIALGDALANPAGLGLGFSNPGFIGLAGLGIREIAKAARRDAVEKINDARLKGLINDANRRVARGTPIGRAGGVGTPGVGGGLTTRRIDPESRRAGAGDRSANAGSTNRGLGSRGDGFKDHFGGPR